MRNLDYWLAAIYYKLKSQTSPGTMGQGADYWAYRIYSLYADIDESPYPGRSAVYWLARWFELATDTGLASPPLRDESYWLQKLYNHYAGLPDANIDMGRNAEFWAQKLYEVVALGFSPADLGNLVMWLDASQITGLADGATIETWTNVVNAAMSPTQATLGLRPVYKTGIINGLPVVRFPTDNFLQLKKLTESTIFAGGLFAGNAATLFTVYQNSVFPANSHFGLLATGSAADGLDLFTTDSYNADFRTTRLAGLALGFPQTGRHLKTVVTSAAAWKLRSDGVQLYSTPTSSWGTGAALHVGKSGHPAGWFNGDMAEVLIYNRALSADEITEVEAYLMDKWGV